MKQTLSRTFAVFTLALCASSVLCASSAVFAQAPAPAAEPAIDPNKPVDIQPVQATTNAKKDSPDPHAWWRGGCNRIEKDIKKMDGNVDVAVVGDSITARWNGDTWTKHWGGYRAVNMGIGGDQTQHVLWRLQHGELDGYKARLFVVNIGTNNCWGKVTVPENVAAGVKAVIDLIHSKQPKAKILLMGIFPQGEKPNKGRETRAAVNALISKFAGGHVQYMDIGAKFLEADGSISKEVMADSLHLTPKGYDIWAEAIAPKVKEILGAPSK